MTVYIPDEDGKFIEYKNVCQLDLLWFVVKIYGIDYKTEALWFKDIVVDGHGYDVHDDRSYKFITEATRKYLGDLFEGLVIKVPTLFEWRELLYGGIQYASHVWSAGKYLPDGEESSFYESYLSMPRW